MLLRWSEGRRRNLPVWLILAAAHLLPGLRHSLFLSVLSILFSIALCRQLNRWFTLRWLNWLGRNTLQIYALHRIFSARASATQNGTDRSANLPGVFNSVTTDQNTVFGSVTVAEDCWRNHTGGYTLNMIVNYAGQSFTCQGQSRGWGGNGDEMYVNRIEND